jgi:hypothetical protein
MNTKTKYFVKLNSRLPHFFAQRLSIFLCVVLAPFPVPFPPCKKYSLLLRLLIAQPARYTYCRVSTFGTRLLHPYARAETTTLDAAAASARGEKSDMRIRELRGGRKQCCQFNFLVLLSLSLSLSFLKIVSCALLFFES